MVKVVSCWHLTVEARVRYRASPCVICSGLSSCVEYVGFPSQYYSAKASVSFIDVLKMIYNLRTCQHH
jgi:hypothetical protein